MKKAKKFPDKYLITPELENCDIALFLERLLLSIKNDIRLVQLRLKLTDLSVSEKVFSRAKSICKENNVFLIINSHLAKKYNFEADGIHLTSSDLVSYKSRPIQKEKLLSASCHTLEQLIHAQSIDVDFVTLSPVLRTKSHPMLAPMGWKRFKYLVSTVKIPIYALGGMNTEHINVAIENGGCGIASITGLWCG